MNEVLLRSLTPSVLGNLVRRGADFAAAEDAVQDALVEVTRVSLPTSVSSILIWSFGRLGHRDDQMIQSGF